MKDIDFDPVTRDIPVKDDFKRASIEHLEFECEGKRILGLMFKSQGRGPHPTAIILHGFPGHDRNLDIGHTLRRGGISSIIFHYRGSWGSEGTISFSNMLVDVKCVLDQIIEMDEELDIDSASISLVGHSMGGWAALMTALDEERIRNLVSVSSFNLGMMSGFIQGDGQGRILARSMLEDLTAPLDSISVNDLLFEIEDHGREWNISHHAGDLIDRSILMIGAKKDIISTTPIHFDPLVASLRDSGISDLETCILDTDHSYSDARIGLQRAIWDFLSKRTP